MQIDREAKYRQFEPMVDQMIRKRHRRPRRYENLISRDDLISEARIALWIALGHEVIRGNLEEWCKGAVEMARLRYMSRMSKVPYRVRKRLKIGEIDYLTWHLHEKGIANNVFQLSALGMTD